MACAPDSNLIAIGTRGIRRDNLFKNAKGRPFISNLSNVIYFLKVQVVTKRFTCPRRESLLVECHPLDDQIVRALLLPTFMFMTAWVF